MLLTCKKCGAPLEAPEQNASFVECRYCRATNDLRQPVNVHAPHMGQHPFPPQMPPPQMPPPQMPPPPMPLAPRAMPQASSASPALAIGLSAAIAVLAGVGVAFFRQASSGSTSDRRDVAPGAESKARSGPANWSGNSSCFVDANGDGILDIAGLAGMAGVSSKPTIIDGKNGKVLYAGGDMGKQASLFCLSKAWILAGADDFEIRLYNARSPDPPKRTKGSDKLRHARLGKNCIAIRTDDDEQMGLALPSGKVTKCKVKLPMWAGREQSGLVGLTGGETRLTRGSKTYIFRKKKSGSGKLSLEVKEGDARRSTSSSRTSRRPLAPASPPPTT